MRKIIIPAPFGIILALPFVLCFVIAAVNVFGIVWIIYNCSMFLKYGKGCKDKPGFIAWLTEEKSK